MEQRLDESAPEVQVAVHPAPSAPPAPPQVAEGFWQRWGGIALILLSIFVVFLLIGFGLLTYSYVHKIQTGQAIDVSRFSAVTQSSTLQNSADTTNTSQTPASASRLSSLVNRYEDDPSFGPANAKVTVVMFEDFECPFCGKAYPTLKKMRQQYGTQVRFIYRDFPLEDIHPNAQKAAEAGQCANEQGLFWEYHDLLYLHQDALAPANLKQYAQQVGLSTGAFNDCLDSGKYQSEVEQDFADGLGAGVQGTPTIFINDNRIQGVVPEATFIELLEYFLKK